MNSHAAHPSSVTLAAFVDGRLSGKDLAQVVQHLASCEDCFEVVAETAEVQEELEEEAASAERTTIAGVPTRRRAERDRVPDKVVLHPSAWRRWAPATALLAAALAVAVVGGWRTGWFFGDPLSMDRLAGRLEGVAGQLDEKAWGDWGWDNYRAPGPNPIPLDQKQASCRVGVLAVDLQLALRDGSVAWAQDLIQRLMDVFDQDSLLDAIPVKSSYDQSVYQPLQDEALPALDLKEVAKAAVEIDQNELTMSLLDMSYYKLGKWAEAGRLAARAKDARALGDRTFRAPIKGFLGVDLDSKVAERLREIQQRLRGRLDEEDLDWLARAFRSIVGGDGVRLQPEIPEPEIPSETSLPSSSPER